MSYSTWQDLLDEEDDSPSPSPADGGAVPVGDLASGGAPDLEAIAGSVPGLADLLTERKTLEKQMKSLLGGEDDSSDPRDNARFPVLEHTPESRMLDRRMHKMETDNHLGRLKTLARKRREQEDVEAGEEQKRRRLAKRSANRKAARRQQAEQDERQRRTLDRDRIESRWRTAKEVARRGRALRGALEKGRLDQLDELRLGKQQDAIRDRFAQSAREGALPPLGLPVGTGAMPLGGLRRRKAPRNDGERQEVKDERRRNRALQVLHEARQDQKTWSTLRSLTDRSRFGKGAMDLVETGLDLDKKQAKKDSTATPAKTKTEQKQDSPSRGLDLKETVRKGKSAFDTGKDAFDTTGGFGTGAGGTGGTGDMDVGGTDRMGRGKRPRKKRGGGFGFDDLMSV